MDDQRWWHVAVVATALVLGVLVAVGHTAAWRVAGVAACNALLVIAWFAVGQRARRRNPALAVPFVAAVILIVGTATAFSPTMATAQCLAYPLVWTFLERLRHAVSADIALAAAVGIGLYLSTGSLVQAIVVQGLSLVFSLSLGLWITSIANRSDERHRLLLELEAAQEKLTALSRDAGAVEERERLVREIHDTIAQDLTGLVLTAQRGLRELRGGDPTAAEAQLEVLEEIARNALAETRALVASGAAVGIDGSGLDASLRHLAERFERETGMTVRVTVDHSPASTATTRSSCCGAPRRPSPMCASTPPRAASSSVSRAATTGSPSACATTASASTRRRPHPVSAWPACASDSRSPAVSSRSRARPGRGRPCACDCPRGRPRDPGAGGG